MADFKLKNVRLSFPDIWKAKEFKPGDGKPRYSATFLIEPGSENDKTIRAAIKAAAEETFQKKADAKLKEFDGQSNKMCYNDGNRKEYDGYEDRWYLACRSKARPKIYDRRPKNPDGSENLLTEEDGRPYAGCYVNATCSIYAQAGEHPGIRASFSGLQFVSDGDAFGAGGRQASADDFEDLGDAEDDDLV